MNLKNNMDEQLKEKLKKEYDELVLKKGFSQEVQDVIDIVSSVLNVLNLDNKELMQKLLDEENTLAYLIEICKRNSYVSNIFDELFQGLKPI